MSIIDDIVDAVRRLSPKDLEAFRSWFMEFDAAAWDKQVEKDIAAGLLDEPAQEALDDIDDGRCTDL